jgi:hypothetical protein
MFVFKSMRSWFERVHQLRIKAVNESKGNVTNLPSHIVAVVSLRRLLMFLSFPHALPKNGKRDSITDT